MRSLVLNKDAECLNICQEMSMLTCFKSKVRFLVGFFEAPFLPYLQDPCRAYLCFYGFKSIWLIHLQEWLARHGSHNWNVQHLSLSAFMSLWFMIAELSPYIAFCWMFVMTLAIIGKRGKSKRVSDLRFGMLFFMQWCHWEKTWALSWLRTECLSKLHLSLGEYRHRIKELWNFANLFRHLKHLYVSFPLFKKRLFFCEELVNAGFSWRWAFVGQAIAFGGSALLCVAYGGRSHPGKWKDSKSAPKRLELLAKPNPRDVCEIWWPSRFDLFNRFVCVCVYPEVLPGYLVFEDEPSVKHTES